MLVKTTLAAAAIALSSLAASVPAQAGSIQFGIHGSNGSVGIQYNDNGHGRDYNRGHGDRRGYGHDRRGYGHAYRSYLAPWQVRRKLRHRGFSHIQFVDRYAPVYKVRATNRHGRHVFLIVSSRTGAIIRWSRGRSHH